LTIIKTTSDNSSFLHRSIIIDKKLISHFFAPNPSLSTQNQSKVLHQVILGTLCGWTCRPWERINAVNLAVQNQTFSYATFCIRA